MVLPLAGDTACSLFSYHSYPGEAANQKFGNVTNITLSVDGTDGNVTANFWIDNDGEAAVTAVAAGAAAAN